MPASDRSHAIDKIVVVLFENRSLDNVLGRLYGPEDGKNFDGVIGKDLRERPRARELPRAGCVRMTVAQ